jgi:hypothetical protein
VQLSFALPRPGEYFAVVQAIQVGLQALCQGSWCLGGSACRANLGAACKPASSTR